MVAMNMDDCRIRVVIEESRHQAHAMVACLSISAFSTVILFALSA